MKVIISLLLLTLFGFGQVYHDYNHSGAKSAGFAITVGAAGEVNGREIITFTGADEKKFEGQVGVEFYFDSTTTSDAGDSIWFFLEYATAGEQWIRSDTLQFYTPSVDTSWADSAKVFVANSSTYKGKNWFYATDPRYPFTNIQSYPIRKIRLVRGNHH